MDRSIEEPPQPRVTQPVDWPALISELQALAEDRLGKRAKKINDLLGSAGLSRKGIEAAIGRIETIELQSVDPVRLGDLAYEMKVRFAAHAGTPPPARLGLAADGPEVFSNGEPFLGAAD